MGKAPIHDRLGQIGKDRFIFNHLPIVLDGEAIGAVSTFRDIGNVIRSENVVRRSLAGAMPERLSTPFNWKGEWVFVDSMSDLFHESIPFEFIAMVYGSMIMNDKNVYVVLTKRIAARSSSTSGR